MLAIGALLGGLAVLPAGTPAEADVAPIGGGAPGRGAPVADAGNVTIRVGGLRNTAGTVDPLAGVTYQFYQATTSGARGDIVTGAVCTTDDTGMCNVTLEPRSVGTGGRYGYLAVATGVPAGYHLIPSLTTGTANDPSTVVYEYQTGGISASDAYTIPASVTAATTRNQTTSGTATPAAYDNPPLQAQCGLNVGLLLDLSSSVSSSDVQFLRQAATGYVNVLAGTPSRVAVTTFGRTSPATSTSGNNNNNLGLTSVATNASADIVRNKIAGLRVPGNEATNWDAGLQAVGSMIPQGLDLVLVLTDGMPTRYGFQGDGSGTTTRYIELEHSIASANMLKEAGVTVQAVGIGAGISGNPANLQAVSGPTANVDYFQVASYQALVSFLQGQAGVGCASTVNVTKTVVPFGGGAPQPAAGWTMTADTSPDPIVRVSGSDDPYDTSAQTTTGATGVASFGLALAEDSSHRVEVREDQLEGFDLIQQSGANAACFDTLNPGTTLPVENLDDPATPGFAVTVPEGRTISCEIRNQSTFESAQARVHKEWYFDLDGDGEFEGPYVAGQELPIPNLSSVLSLSGAGVVAPPHFFETLYANLTPGQSLDVQETVTGLPPLCTNEAQGLGPHALEGTGGGEFVNEITVENYVTCHSALTLEKEVVSVSDTATPEDWLLNSYPIDAPSGTHDGVRDAVTGTDAATAEVSNGVRYALNEVAQTEDARTEFIQRWSPSLTAQWEPAVANGATGSWVCVLARINDQGEYEWTSDQFDGRNGGVTVGIGQWAKCTAENRHRPNLELIKRVFLDGAERTPSPELAANWALSGEWQSPINPIDGVPFTPPFTQDPNPVTGEGGFGPATVLTGSYLLTESGDVEGYENGDEWSCVLDGRGEPLIIDEETPRLNLESGVSAACTIVNRAVQPTLQLDKTVDGPDGPENWILTGTPLTAVDPPSPIVTNPDGGATDAVEVWTSTGYHLSEAPAPGFDDGDYVRGEWSCEIVDGPTSPALELEQLEPGEAELGPLSPGQVVECDVENTVRTASVELGKGFDGPGSEDDWVLTGSDDEGILVNPDEAPGHVDPTEVPAGTDVQLAERGSDGFDETGYSRGEWACEIVGGPPQPEPVVTPGDPGEATLGGLAPGQEVSCEVVNTALPPGLGLSKTVTGPASADDWVLGGAGDDGTELNPDGVPGDVPAQQIGFGESFQLSEGPADGFDDGDYERLGWTCAVVDGPALPEPVVENGDDGSASLAPLAPGQQVVCTAENRIVDPTTSTIALDKIVAGDPGDVTADDWVLTGSIGDEVVVNPEGRSGAVASTRVDAGVQLVLRERPAAGVDETGFTRGEWSCVVVAGDGPDPAVAPVPGEPGAATVGPIAPGQAIDCEITNVFAAPVPPGPTPTPTPTPIPSTGVDASWPAVTALLLLLAGAAFVIRRRRGHAA